MSVSACDLWYDMLITKFHAFSHACISSLAVSSVKTGQHSVGGPCWHAVALTCKLKRSGWRWWRGPHGSTVSACCGADAGCRPPVQVCREGGNTRSAGRHRSVGDQF